MSDKKPTHADSENEEKTGYGRPPKSGQFKPGKSGNKKGRPRGSRNFRTDVEEALKARVTVTQGGKPRKMSTQQAGIAVLLQKALNGDGRALLKMLDLAGTHNDAELVIEPKDGQMQDSDILKAYNERLESHGDGL